MKWADLSNEAQSILEWVEHVITGRRQTLRIKLGETFHQSCIAFGGDVDIPVTQELFQEIKTWLPFSEDTVYEIQKDLIVVKLKEEVILH